jgi:L-iditol 2-dehydrogenase
MNNEALRIHGIHDLRLGEEPVPQPKDGEALLRVTAVGVCGSDVHWFTEGGIGGTYLEEPLILGHEFCAVVESVPLKGKRVTVEPAIPCGECDFAAKANLMCARIFALPARWGLMVHCGNI